MVLIAAMRPSILIALLIACSAPPARPVAPAPAPAPAPAVPATGSPTAATPPPAPAAPAPAPKLPPGVPDTVAGRQLAWVLDVLDHGGKVDAATIEAHFDRVFLDQVPVDQTITVFVQLAASLGNAKVVDVQTLGGLKLQAKLEVPGGTKLRVGVSVDEKTGKMDGLLFRPDTGPKPKSYAEAIEAAKKLAPKAQLLVAAVDRGTCRPLQALEPKAELAIGSTTKLYVLLALADRILAGKAKWDDELAVRDEWKSLPSGITQDDPAGTKRTIRTLAERMISISDNTATDHLLYTLGRKEVEAALRGTGHARPALDAPFLSTRELFLLKLALTPDEVKAYLARPEAGRRTYLDRDLAARRPTMQGIETWTAPRWIDQLEWFASADDLCRVMGALWSRAQRPAAAPLLEVLSKNPGIEIAKPPWKLVGYKGGSEPGVLNMTWLLQRDDDRWFFVTLGFNSTEKAEIDEGAAIGIAGGVIDLLANEGRAAAK